MTAWTGTGAVSVLRDTLSLSVVVRIAGEVDDRLELISVGKPEGTQMLFSDAVKPRDQ